MPITDPTPEERILESWWRVQGQRLGCFGDACPIPDPETIARNAFLAGMRAQHARTVVALLEGQPAGVEVSPQTRWWIREVLELGFLLGDE